MDIILDIKLLFYGKGSILKINTVLLLLLLFSLPFHTTDYSIQRIVLLAWLMLCNSCLIHKKQSYGKPYSIHCDVIDTQCIDNFS